MKVQCQLGLEGIVHLALQQGCSSCYTGSQCLLGGTTADNQELCWSKLSLWAIRYMLFNPAQRLDSGVDVVEVQQMAAMDICQLEVLQSKQLTASQMLAHPCLHHA